MKKTLKDPMEVFEAAMENIMPALEVKAREELEGRHIKFHGSTPERRQTLLCVG